MTKPDLIHRLITEEGTILQHCDRHEYVKNECGIIIWCCNHWNRKEIKVIGEDACRDLLINKKYVLPYTYGPHHDYSKVFEYVASEIQDHEDVNCIYEGDDNLVNYLAKG